MIRMGVVVGLMLTLALSGTATARTANTALGTVPKVARSTSAITASVLAPAGCTNRAGLAATNVFVATASGNVSGGTGNDLVLGRPNTGNYTLSGGNGNDCLVGGRGTAGTETFNGGNNTDVCIGNSFTGGSQTFKANCETQIP